MSQVDLEIWLTHTLWIYKR